MEKKEYYIEGKTAKVKIYGYAYVPDERKFKGYIQVVHDMYDYMDRYDEVLKSIAEQGYLIFGCDLIGHGKSCESQKLGKMLNYTTKDLIEDIHNFYLKILSEYAPFVSPIDIKIKSGKMIQLVKPQLHCMIGMGFGCSLIRSYCIHYKDVNSLVFIGDMGLSNKYSKVLSNCEKALKANKNDNANSIMIRELLQKNWNANFNDNKLYRNSYRCSSLQQIRAINADIKCNFEYDLHAIKLILTILNSMSISQWINVFPKYMPLYELSGYLDPINNYTRELDDILTKFRYSANKNIFYKYYEDARHELCFEKNVKQVIKDIVYFNDNILNELNKTYENQRKLLETKERE